MWFDDVLDRNHDRLAHLRPEIGTASRSAAERASREHRRRILRLQARALAAVAQRRD